MIQEYLKGVPTPELATIFPMIGATQIWARYVIPNTGPNWFGVAPFLVASIGKKGAWRCLLLFQYLDSQKLVITVLKNLFKLNNFLDFDFGIDN